MKYSIYRDNEFKKWKRRVYDRLPKLCMDFYSSAGRMMYPDYERKLGALIQKINDPYTAITTGPNGTGEPCDPANKIASQILLKLLCEEVFHAVYRNKILD